jgi:hypothetical protein
MPILPSFHNLAVLLFSDKVLPRMKAILPWVKLLVILRNPVDRAYSQYQMSVDKSGTAEQIKVRGQSSYLNKSFLEVILEEIQLMKDLEISVSLLNMLPYLREKLIVSDEYAICEL